jgi:hypothetical protein
MLLILWSCTKVSKEKLLINSLIISSQSEEGFTRTVASDETTQCMRSQFKVENLKREIEGLESLYTSAEKVKGFWRHVDLSHLPVPQANFLLLYGDKIGDLRDPNTIDYSSCSDLPCIFNKIYKDELREAGPVHYLWYLKFGHMLSLDNQVPKQRSKSPGVFQQKEMPLEKYLYSRDELYAFWKLTHMLDDPFLNIEGLKEIQRIPQGEIFEERDYSTACGLSSGAGWIKLTDQCLQLEKNGEEGYLYFSLVHELGHQIDFAKGKNNSNDTYRSHQEDYLNVSGFYLFEYKDENDFIHREWKIKSGVQTLSPYAAENPQENFAEVIAYYRLEGEKAKKELKPKHYDFMLNEIFKKSAPQSKILLDFWLRKYKPLIFKTTTDQFLDCKRSDNCHEQQVFENVFELITSKIKTSEPEACGLLNPKESKQFWAKLVRKTVEKLLKEHEENFSDDNDYLVQLSGIRKDQASELIGFSAFLNCFKFVDLERESCYRGEVLSEFREPVLGELYLKFYPLSMIENSAGEKYNHLVRSKLQMIQSKADGVWRICTRFPINDDEPPQGEAFNLLDGYMVSSQFNCLNNHFGALIDEILQNFGDLEHPGEREFIIKKLKSMAQEFLKKNYEAEMKKELLAVDKISKKENLKLAKMTFPVGPDCYKTVMDNLSYYPRYHLKKDFFSELLKQYCPRP